MKTEFVTIEIPVEHIQLLTKGKQSISDYLLSKIDKAVRRERSAALLLEKQIIRDLLGVRADGWFDFDEQAIAFYLEHLKATRPELQVLGMRAQNGEAPPRPNPEDDPSR